MLPLGLLHAAQGKPMMVELKNGETFNGHLIACDNFMNLTLKEVYQTSVDGTQFWKMPEVYIKGLNVKYIRVSDTVVDEAKKNDEAQRARGATRGGAGGARGGDRGRGRGGRGGNPRGGAERGGGGRGGRGKPH